MSAEMPYRIFVNYRREDSGGHAGRLYDKLAAHFGAENVFMDIDAIDPGVDFVQVIEEALADSDAFLALIGRDWATVESTDGRRRLDDPNDFVRIEVAHALQRDDVRVYPVLLQKTGMPPDSVLPPDLKPLRRRNAVELRDTAWHADVERFIDALEEARAERDRILAPPPPPPWHARLRARAAALPRRVLLGAAAVALLVVLAAVLALVLSGGGEAEGFGGSIAYERDGRIWILSGATGEETQLEGSVDGDANPDWLRNETMLAFVRNGDITFQPLDEPGEATPVLVDGPVVQDSKPSWSPDGTRLVWSRKDGDVDTIVVADARMGAPVTDLTGISGRRGVSPAWSPAGDLIAFHSGGAVWVMDADGRGAREVSEQGEFFPAWSPDGERLAFVTTTGSKVCKVVVLDVATGTRTMATDGDPGVQCRDISFSPDGSEIAVTNQREGGGIWIVSADGGEEARKVSSQVGIRGLTWGDIPGG